MEFNLNRFLHYYNWILKHTTTCLTLKYVIENFNDNLIRENIQIENEKSRKNIKKYFYKKKEMKYKYNWINKIISKKPYFNKEKSKKEVSIKENKRYDIVGVATKVKQQVLYVKVTIILNGRLNVKIYNKIRVK